MYIAYILNIPTLPHNLNFNYFINNKFKLIQSKAIPQHSSEFVLSHNGIGHLYASSDRCGYHYWRL